MQRWHDLGQFKSHAVTEFEPHAKAILQAEGLQGSLARLFLRESRRGEWGDTRRDLPQRAMEALLMMLEGGSAIQITEQGARPAQFGGGHPEIESALENDKAKMLVATMPDGTRCVAILLIK